MINTTIAQDDTSSKIKKESYITLDVVSPLYFNTINVPRWRIGYIQEVSNKIMLGISLGYGTHATSILKTNKDYSLWEIRPEIFYNLGVDDENIKSYVSLELFYINHEDRFTNDDYKAEDGVFYAYDTADYEREKMGLIFKYGVMFYLSNHLGLNAYTGLGIRTRNNIYTKVVNPIPTDFDEPLTPFYKQEGNHFFVELSLGLKLFYKI